MESKSYTMDFAGRPLTLEFGRYCEQANGSVWVHLGDTVVMVNATMAPAPRDGVVASIAVNKGSSVQAGDLLISLN